MQPTCLTTVADSMLTRLQLLSNADPHHPHIHTVDMPYRLTSTWQDQGCELGLWEKDGQLLAWAVFQPAWWNFDYAIQPTERESTLEQDILAWGQQQIIGYANRSGESFYGSVELFEDTPKASQTIAYLESLGFQKFTWTTIRFEINLQQTLPLPQLPAGFTIRPLQGQPEVEAYVNLHRAAFGSDKMTTAWRTRTLAHPAYRPEIDLVVADADNKPAGFCICWLWQNIGQIEPLGVHPDYQRLGLGRALELAALQILRDHGVKSAYVDHVSLNEKAIALSLQTGFKQINNALRYFIDVGPET